MRSFAPNPPWVDRILNSRWTDIEHVVGSDRMPVPAPTTKKKMQFAEYGCGHYGCVLPSRSSGMVFKVTSDPTEASFIVAAASIVEMPDGIVRYGGVWRIEGEAHRGRPVFVVLREEASDVGGLTKAYGQRLPLERRVLLRLDQFRIWASIARDYIKQNITDRMLKEIESLGDWASDSVDYERATALPAPYSGSFKVGPPSHIRGAWRAAYAIKACEYVAQEMVNEDVGYLVGGALGFYLDHGLLLADVHGNNVGRVERDDYTKPPWVITDPGHMVPLRWKFTKLHVPTI